MKNRSRIPVFTIAAGLSCLLLWTQCGLEPGDTLAAHSGQSAIIFVRQPIESREGNVMASNVDEFTEGTDIVKLSPIGPSGNLTNLTHQYHNGEGAAMDPEVSHDGRKILFSMKKGRNDPWRIYEMNADGTGLEPLTNPPTGGSFNRGGDFDPAYLPNGDIVFVSTRSQIVDEYERRESPLLHVGVRTGGHTGNIPNENVRQISFNQSHDANPMVHSSGKIYFSRWEHLGDPNKFTLFSINPDGSGLFFLYGAHTPEGDNSRVMLEARELGDRGLAVSVMTRTAPHEGGAIGILNLNEVEGEVPFVTDADVLWDNNGDDATKALYKTPYPIMDGTRERLLVAISPIAVNGNMNDPAADYGIYIMNKNGDDETLIFNDPDYHELDPMPLKASHLPEAQVIEMREDIRTGLASGATTGFFFNQNAYLRSSDRQPVPDPDVMMPDGIKGEARYYRVLEAVPMPRDRDLRGGSLGNTSLEKQRVIGYIPIREDGSTSMEVPANRSLHLQSVDYRGLMLVNQLTWVQVMPGERRVCTGCHGPHDEDQAIFNIGVMEDNSVRDTINGVTYASGFFNAENPLTYSPGNTGYVPSRPDTLDFYSSNNNFTVQNIFKNRCYECHGASVAANSGGGLSLEHGELTGEGTSDVYEHLTEDGRYANTDREYVDFRDGARESPLIWVLFNEQLDASSRTDYQPTSYDHSEMWDKTDGRVDPFLESNADLLTLIEWVDMGTQYSNTVGYDD